MTHEEAMAILTAAGVPGAARDLRKLEAEALDFADAVRRRANREPVSQILGYRDFWKHRFKVTPQVLDPRPETELLVELSLAEPFARVLDLGTGSGAILISLLAERPAATGVGTDLSEDAVLIAGENAVMAGVEPRITLPISDWFDDIGGRFDLIVSNPPYIATHERPSLAPEVRDHEPAMALFAGEDGLDAYRTIAARAPDHLTPGGRLLVEIGPTQSEAVRALFFAAGLEDIRCHSDLDGRDRVVSARAKARP